VANVPGFSFDQRTFHILYNTLLVSLLFLTMMFNVDTTVPHLAVMATGISLLISTWSRVSIFSLTGYTFLFLGSPILMEVELKPEIKVKLFATLICSRFMKQHTVI
jgi:hypothetical protein